MTVGVGGQINGRRDRVVGEVVWVVVEVLEISVGCKAE